jgi:glycosyltransferase involved in cell wall biosynthesis
MRVGAHDVHFPGWMAQEDLPAVYSLADLYLHPARLETFGIPIAEAMACGTPIVTSPAHALREIAGDGAVFVEPSDHQGIADAIVRILSDSDLWSRMRSAGMTRSQRYSWDRCARRTLAVLEWAARDGDGTAAAAAERAAEEAD